MLFAVYLGCTPVLDQVRQIYPELHILPKLNQVKQSLTHANTLTNTLTKTRTNRWPTDTPLAPSAIPQYIQIHPTYTTNTPTSAPTKNAHKYTYS